MKKKITIKVSHDLEIGVAMLAETKESGESVFTIDPPEITPINQVLRWLKKKPAVPISQMTPATMGIGLTALCVRWGTWLAYLLDGNKPVDPRAKMEDVSTISEQELARIYTEASFNLEQMLKLWFENEEGFWAVLAKAYQYLPMPCVSGECDPKAVETEILAPRASIFDSWGNPDGAAQFSEDIRETPFRVLSNALIKAVVFRSELPNFSKGTNKAYSLKKRRLTPSQELQIFHDISRRMAGIVYHRPVWQSTSWPDSVSAIRTNSIIYPETWSLSAASLPLFFDEHLRNEWPAAPSSAS